MAVHTAQGSVRCAHLVLCGNAYIGAVAPALARRILGVGTYIIATEPLGEGRAQSLLPSNAAIADINWILDYFRRSADHRLLFGGRVSYSAVQPPRPGGIHAPAHAARFPDTCGCESRLCMGRLSRHHHEPRAGFRAPRPQRVLPAGVLRARHGT